MRGGVIALRPIGSDRDELRTARKNWDNADWRARATKRGRERESVERINILGIGHVCVAAAAGV